MTATAPPHDDAAPTPAPYIVFGYGSLIFRPPPHVIHETPGFLKGYVRRFAQKSHDHRGTPEHPGRVVTLVHQEDWAAFSAADAFPHEDVVWGVAFTIDPAHARAVRDELGIRAQDGYTPERVDVYNHAPDGTERVAVSRAECYVGRSDNPSFIGAEPLDALARTIWAAVGPSGRNKDYLYNLAAAVRALAPEAYDSHLFALEVRASVLSCACGAWVCSCTTWFVWTGGQARLRELDRAATVEMIAEA
ncbi:ChaC-like protein [Gloeopeniophorella convolvens]|nr:ChaC-like protein [Gloeopeniophorella convolvens]